MAADNSHRKGYASSPCFAHELELSSDGYHIGDSLAVEGSAEFATVDRDALAKNIVDAMPDALVVSNASGVITYWNAGANRVFGFTESEAVGQSLDIIIPEKLRARHWSGYKHTVRTGESRYGAGELLSVPAIRKDGATISVQFSITPLTDGEGRMTGMAAIMRDVTAEFEERKRLKAALAEA